MKRATALTTVAAMALLAAVATLAPSAAADSPGTTCVEASCFTLESTIAFSSTRDGNLEIYLIEPDGTNLRRLTENIGIGDAFATLSPDGKKIAFDSNRNRLPSEPVNTSDLFVMNTDGSEQTFVTRGSSPTWSPDSKDIAFHASASGTGLPLRTDPGAATSDSDIFVANVDDVLAGVAAPRNITNSGDKVDDDADWSPDGQRLAYTAHDVVDDPPVPAFLSNTAEIYVVASDGSGQTRLTTNGEEERSPAWSPDGTRIVYSCRVGGGNADFEICVMNADGSNQVQLTSNGFADLTATWSPEGNRIVFHRPLVIEGVSFGNQLFTMTPALNPDGSRPTATPVTSPPGVSLLANWGQLRVRS